MNSNVALWVRFAPLMLCLACSGNPSNFPKSNSVRSHGDKADLPRNGAEADGAPTPAAPPTPAPSIDLGRPEALGATDNKTTPPHVISGSYLYCSPNQLSELEVDFYCSLKHPVSQINVDLNTHFLSYDFLYVPTGLDLAVSSTRLLETSGYQGKYKVKHLGSGSARTAFSEMQFNFSGRTRDGMAFEAKSLPVKFVPKWITDDAGRIPGAALLGGTEQGVQVNIYVCRIYIGNEIISGKLVAPFTNDPAFSCYGAKENIGVQFSFQDFSQSNRPEILEFDNRMAWAPASNGAIPSNSLITGVDSSGAASYTCRALEKAGNPNIGANHRPNLPEGEMTPGTLRFGGTGCNYEYFGGNSVAQYEVLTIRGAP